MGCGKQRETTAPIRSLVKLQPRFLSLRWKTCLRQNCSLDSCTWSEKPVLGQNTLMIMMTPRYLKFCKFSKDKYTIITVGYIWILYYILLERHDNSYSLNLCPCLLLWRFLYFIYFKYFPNILTSAA